MIDVAIAINTFWSSPFRLAIIMIQSVLNEIARYRSTVNAGNLTLLHVINCVYTILELQAGLGCYSFAEQLKYFAIKWVEKKEFDG